MSFPKSVSDVIVKARDRYGDLSQTKALDYFANAWRYLCDSADIRYSSETISITAGTRDYNVPNDVMDLSAVYYQRTSDPGTWYQMFQRSIDELDLTRQGWRSSAAQSEPVEFAITTKQSGNTSQLIMSLVQLPNATTSAGYPCITFWGQAITDMLVSDTLPAFVSTDEYFVNSIKRQYAETSDSTSIAMWRTLEEAALGRLTRHIRQLAAHQGTRIIPGWTQRQTSPR